MAKSAKTPDPKDERREGYKLPITMLRQLEASTELCDACALDELVTGRATKQDNIVALIRGARSCCEIQPGQLNAGATTKRKRIAVPFVVGNAKTVEAHYSCHPFSHDA